MRAPHRAPLLAPALVSVLAVGLFGAAPLWAGEMTLPTLYTLHCSGCHGEAGHGVPASGVLSSARGATLENGVLITDEVVARIAALSTNP